MGLVFEAGPPPSSVRLLIVAARWNALIVDRLIDAAQATARRAGLPDDAVDIAYAPGAFELPAIAKSAIDSGRYDGVVALGCVIRGQTPHFDYVAGAAATGLARLALESGKPVAFGVLTLDTLEQGLDRAGGKIGNKGEEAMRACLDALSVIAAIGGAS